MLTYFSAFATDRGARLSTRPPLRFPPAVPPFPPYAAQVHPRDTRPDEPGRRDGENLSPGEDHLASKGASTEGPSGFRVEWL
jgi:hypothetical protein